MSEFILHIDKDGMTSVGGEFTDVKEARRAFLKAVKTPGVFSAVVYKLGEDGEPIRRVFWYEDE